MRPRRSLLFVPGSTPERIVEAVTSAADGIILDLEDTVTASQKPQAREWVVAALRRVDFRGRERIVRINPRGGPFGAEDLAAVVPAAPDAVLLPKVGEADEVARVDHEMGQHERAAGLVPGTIRLHLLVETVAGVLNAETVARGSARTVALLYGAGDLMRETGGRPVPGRATELCVLTRLLLAARSAGLDAIDSPCFALRDPTELERHTRAGADLGYDGKAVLHADQIGVVNRLFTPSAEAVARARGIIAAWEQAEAAGSGAVMVDGQFIDVVHLKTARDTLARAERCGAV